MCGTYLLIGLKLADTLPDVDHKLTRPQARHKKKENRYEWICSQNSMSNESYVDKSGFQSEHRGLGWQVTAEWLLSYLSFFK